MKFILPVALALTALPAALSAQHDHAHSPYADMEIDRRASLPIDEVNQLRAGEGMGLALPAELNSYPGPRHVIDMAGMLGLTTAQQRQLATIRGEMTNAAVAKGMEILEARAALTALFAEGTADQASVEAATARVGTLQGELQAIHLSAHLLTRSLLTAEQIALYDRHRGYEP